MSTPVEKSVRCTCIGGEHYIHFTGFQDEPLLYIDLNAKHKWPFWERVKEAWKLLKGEGACYDGIILDEVKSNEVIDFLKKFWSDFHEKEKNIKR